MGTKPLQEGRETSTSLNYPKESIERGKKNPLKRLKKEKKGSKKEKKKVGAQLPWRLRHPR